MCLEEVCEYHCVINAFIGRCFLIVCSNPPDFADNKPFFAGLIQRLRSENVFQKWLESKTKKTAGG